MNVNHYRFENHWRIPAPKAAVFAALANIEEYPSWWPEYRSVRRQDARTVAVTVRSVLPYTLSVTNTRAELDEARGYMKLILAGEIEGWSSVQVSDDGSNHSTVELLQDCVTARRLLRVLAPVARPVLRQNHAVMMRHGERRLRAHLAVRG